MDTGNRIRVAGMILAAAGLLWAVAILIEYHYGLKPPNHGALYALDQGMFYAAQVGYVVGIFGLMWARAVGDGWFGRGALGLFAVGWIVLLVAAPLAWLTRDNNNALFPIGGLTATLGGLLAGVAVALAGQWRGWRRFTVLFYSLYYLCVMILPLIIWNYGPTLIREALWGLAWLPVSFALLREARADRIPASIGTRATNL